VGPRQPLGQANATAQRDGHHREDQLVDATSVARLPHQVATVDVHVAAGSARERHVDLRLDQLPCLRALRSAVTRAVRRD